MEGTLGFLTPFDVTNYRAILEEMLSHTCTGSQEGVWCTLRTRMRCEVVGPDGKVSSAHYVLNECVVDNQDRRGGLCKLETFVDDHLVTT